MLPLWGGLLGALGAEIFLFAARDLGDLAAALAATIFWIVAGLTDRLALGFARPWILNLGISACWIIALQHFDSSRVLGSAVTAQSISRAGAIGLAWVSRPAADGFGIASRIDTRLAAFAIVQGLLATFIGGVRVGLLLIAASYLVLRLMQEWCYRRRGGIDATGFGVAQTAIELLAILIWSVIQF